MEIKLWYANFWSDLNPDTFYFTNLLRKHNYNVTIDNKNPDIVIFSVFHSAYQIHNYPNAVKVFYTGENIRPNMDTCDYALTFDFINNERHLRFPIYNFYYDEISVRSLYDRNLDLNTRTKFCAFIHSNSSATKRNSFFNLLNEYKKVDSGGRAFNNIGYLVDDKIEWLKGYKFCMCFENASYDGYTTEKLVQGMMGGCIPIYWGSPSVSKEFNTESFINWHDYNDDQKVIDKIIELDNNPEIYMEYYKQPYLIGNKPNEWMSEDRILNFFKRIVDHEL